MTWTQETGNKEFQVKNWHLKKNDGKKNRKQKRSRKKIGILEKWLGTKKRKAKNSNWKTGT